MEKVTVQKDQLLATLQANKETHVADFEIAWEKYVEAARHDLEEKLRALKDVRKGQMVNLWVNLDTPENHEDDYVRAIEMLQWETGHEVVLSQREFQQLVQDQWSWKGQFEQSNKFYTGTVSPSSIGLS